MKKYLKDLEAELRKNNLSDEEINEILADHEEMIEAAQTEGLSDEELVEKLGNPDKLAKELSEFADQKSEESDEATENNGKHAYEFQDIEEGYDTEITLVNEDIKLKVFDEERIVINVKGKFKPELYDITFKNNKLTLKRKKKSSGSYFGIRRNVQFIVKVPKSKMIGNFEMKLVNGDAEILSIASANSKITTSNGDLDINDFKTTDFKLNTVNGDANIKKLQAENFETSVVNGDIVLEDTKVKEDIRMNSVSGDVKITNSECEDFTISTVSGDVIGKEFYPETVKLRSVSGDIKIVNTDLLRPIEVKSKKSVSGDIDIITK